MLEYAIGKDWHSGQKGGWAMDDRKWHKYSLIVMLASIFIYIYSGHNIVDKKNNRK